MCQSKERNFSFQCPRGNTIILQKFYSEGTEQSYSTTNEDEDDDGWWSVVPQSIQNEIKEKLKAEELIPKIQEVNVSLEDEHLHTPDTQRHYKIETPSTRIQTPRFSQSEDLSTTQQTTQLMHDKTQNFEKFTPNNGDNLVFGNRTPSRNSEKFKSVASTPSTVLMNSSPSSKNKLSRSTPGSPLSNVQGEEELSPFISISKFLDQSIGDSPGWLSSPTQRGQINSINSTQIINTKASLVSTPFSKIRRFSLGGVSRQYSEHSPKSWSPLDTPSRVKPKRELQELTMGNDDASNSIEYTRDVESSLKIERISKCNSTRSLTNSSLHSSNSAEHYEILENSVDAVVIKLPSRSPSTPTMSQDLAINLTTNTSEAVRHMSPSYLSEPERKAESTSCINTDQNSTQDCVPEDGEDLESAERSLSPSLFENAPNESEHSSTDCTDLPSEDDGQCEGEGESELSISNQVHQNTSFIIDEQNESCEASNVKENCQDNVDGSFTNSDGTKEQSDAVDLFHADLSITRTTNAPSVSTQMKSTQFEPKLVVQSSEVSTEVAKIPSIFEETTTLDLSVLKSQGFRTGSGRVLPLPSENELREAENALLFNRPINANKLRDNTFRAKTLGVLAQEAKIKSLNYKNSKIEHTSLTSSNNIKTELSVTGSCSDDEKTAPAIKRISISEQLVASDAALIVSKKPRLMNDQCSEIPEINGDDILFNNDEKPDFGNIENTLLTFGGFSTGKGKKLQPPNKASLQKAMGLFETTGTNSIINSYKTNISSEKQQSKQEAPVYPSTNDSINAPNNIKRPLIDNSLPISSKRRSLNGPHLTTHKEYVNTGNTLPNIDDSPKETNIPLMEDLQEEFHDIDVAAIVKQFGGFTSGFGSGFRSTITQPKGSNIANASEVSSNPDNIADTPLARTSEKHYEESSSIGSHRDSDREDEHKALSHTGSRKPVSLYKSSLEESGEDHKSTTENIPKSYTCGFSTGAGKKLTPPSKNAMVKAASIFNDLKENDIQLSFSTGGGKKLATPSKSSLQQAYELFNDVNDTTSLNASNHQLGVTNLGFSTGAGKKLATPTKSSLEQAQKLFNDENDVNLNTPTYDSSALNNLGFSTGAGKKLAAPSESSLQRVKELFNQDVFNDSLGLNENLLLEEPKPVQWDKSSTISQAQNGQPNTQLLLSKDKMIQAETPQKDIGNYLSSSSNPNNLSQHLLSTGIASTLKRQACSVEALDNVGSKKEGKSTPAHPFRPTPNRVNAKPVFKTPIRKSISISNAQDSNPSPGKSSIDKTEFKELTKTQHSTPKPYRARLTKPFKSPMMSPRPQSQNEPPVATKKTSRPSREEAPLRPSDIFNMRATAKRISLRDFIQDPANSSVDTLLKYNLPVEVGSINSSNAAQYCFKSTTNNSFKFTNDCWGFEDAHKELAALGCKSPQFSDRWTENHYRWIIWKFASYVRLYPQKFSDWWSPERVLNQLRYRYEKEINLGHRSALKRIIERDDSPAKPMTLCISAILENLSFDKNNNTTEITTDDTNQNISKYVLELTDGWYSLCTHIDKPLQRAIDSQKLRVGHKLSIIGARLVGSSEATPALEVSEATFLKITSNGCRIAPWDAKLGYNKQSVKVSLGAVSAEGGLIPCVDVIVMRKYPMCYMEIQPDGTKTFRNAKDEEARERENQDQMAAEARSLFDKYTPNENITTPKSSTKKKNISNIESGQELHEEMLNHVDPTGFLESLTSTQRTRLEQHMLQSKERQQSEIMKEINEHLESSKQRRNVVPFFKIRVCDCPTFTHSNEASITIWRPDLSTYDMLLEGHRYKIYSLSASNKTTTSFSIRKQINLTASRTTSWKEMPISLEDKQRSLFSPREAILCDELDGLNKGQEIDIALIVLSVNHFSDPIAGRSQDISIFASDYSQKIIQINTNGKAGHLKVNDIVGFVNLLYIRKDPVRNTHILSVTQDTEIKPFTRVPHLRQIGLSIEDWTKKNPEHVKNLILSTEDIPEHGNGTFTDLSIQSPAPYALTPLSMKAKLPNASSVNLFTSPATDTFATPCLRRFPAGYDEQPVHRTITGSIIDLSIGESSNSSANIALCIDDGVQIWLVKANRQSFKSIERLVDLQARMHINLQSCKIDVSLNPAYLQTFLEQFIRFKQEKVYPTLILNEAITIPKISTILMTANLVDPPSLYEQYQRWLCDQDLESEENVVSPTADVNYTPFFTTLVDVTKLDSNLENLCLPLLSQEWKQFSNLLVASIRQITLQCTIISSEDGWELETIEPIDPERRTVDLLKQLNHILDV